MDWRDLLDERKRRALSNTPTVATRFASAPTSEDEGPGGFFGNINPLKAIGDAGNAVGGFFGGIVDSVVTDAKNAVGGLKEVIEGQGAAGKLKEAEELQKKRSKEYAAKFNNATEAQWNDPEFRKKAQAFTAETERLVSQIDTKGARKEISESSAVDPLKTAAATASTALNVGTLGVGGIVKNAGRQAVVKGAELLGKDVAENVAGKVAKKITEETAENVAKREAADTAARTASGAARRVGAGAFEGAAFGASTGFLDPFAKEGKDADIEDAWQGALIGAGVGGAFGGAIPLLDRNVRVGVREIPGAARQGAQDVAEKAREFTPAGIAEKNPEVQALDDHMADLNLKRDQLIANGLTENSPEVRANGQAYADALAQRNQTMKLAAEGGYVKLPGGGSAVDDAMDGADIARRQLDGEDIRPQPEDMESQYVRETVAANSSPSQFVDDIVNRIWNENKTGKGVDTALIRDSTGNNVTGRATMSNNSKFYSDFYKEYGNKPTKEAIRDMVRQQVSGEEGTYKNLLGPNEVSPVDRDIYAQLRDREAGLEQTMEAGAPRDLYNEFTQNLNPPVAKRGRTSAVPENPYEGMSQNLETPALPQGELPAPPTVAQAKNSFSSTGEAPEFVNRQRPGRTVINLPANSEDLSGVATRTTPKGKVVPIKNGSEYVSSDVMDGVKELQSVPDRYKKISPLTDLNTIMEQLTRNIGGVKSKAGQVFESIRAKVQEADAQVVRFNNDLRKLVNDDFKTYNFTPEQWDDVNKWLSQQSDPAKRQAAYDELMRKHGGDVAGKAQNMFNEWSPRLKVARDAYNAKVEALGYPDRKMGDLGEFYWPRVYQQQSFKDKATDLAGSIIDLKSNGLDNTGYNPNTMSGSTTAGNLTLPGQGRTFTQAPIGSEFSKPTVGFTGHAKSRTAASPVEKLVNPLEAATKYLESVNAITVNTDAVHQIRGVQAAIKAVQKETDDNAITVIHDVLDNVANPLLGKTNEIDRSLAKYYAGQKAMEWGGFLAKQLSRSQLLGSVRTVLAQTGQVPLLTAEVGAGNAAKGIRAMFSKKFDDLMATSDFLVSNKFMGNEAPFSASQLKRAAQKGERGAAWAMEATAAAMAKASWAGAYIKATQAGLTGKAAVKEADRIAGKIVGNRVAGLRPSLYESRAAQGIAMYTLDINQMYQATKGYLGEKNYKALGTLLGAAYAYNLLYEQLTGDPLVADPLGAGADAMGTLTADNDMGAGERIARAGGRLAGEGLALAPLGNVAGGLFPEEGVKIPFTNDRSLSRQELFGNSQVGRYGPSAPLSAVFENPAYLTGIPGLAQAQRSVGGLQAYNEGASIAPSGNVRFGIEQDAENWWNALLYGQFNTREGQEYIRQLSANQQGL